ncbi:transposase [Teichococcus aerofrigidensis]
MADLFWLTKAQIRRIAPYFPLSHGVPRVDDQRVVSGILHVIRNGLRWRDAPCIPSSRSRKLPIPYDKALYRQRHRIENMFGRLEDWRRIAMRYDRCAHTFMSAICLAATTLFWINEA